ncbi:hypothetical protein [Thalassotalea fusca]
MKQFALCLSLIFTHASAMAEDTTWSAFGTLGIVSSDSDQYGFRRNINYDEGVFKGDIDFKQLSLLGGQLEHRFSGTFDFVTQAVIRDRKDADWDDYVSLAFLRYSPSAQWTLRAGRLAPDLFTISDYRDINIAYTWANVPNEVYGMIPYTYFDGGDVSYTHRFSGATFNVKAFAGISESAISTGHFTQSVDLEEMLGVAMTFDKNDWNLQWRFTRASIGSEEATESIFVSAIAQIPDALWPNKQNIFNDLALDGQKVNYQSFSGQKYLDNWLLSFEITHTDSDTDAIAELTNGYISAAYLQGANTWYGVIGQTNSDSYHFNEPGVNPLLFPEIVSGIESNFNFYSSSQQSISLGWRWDISPTITSKLQMTYTHIDEDGDTLWINRGNDSPAQSVTTLIYTLSFAL